MITLLNHMGTDNSICDAARVSMGKSSDGFTPDQNKKLISYLAKNNHWSPFAHTTVQFRFTAPIFIARQLQKHQVGFAWNEVSRRYVSNTPVMWYPDHFRTASASVKQGSTDQKHHMSDTLVALFKASNETALAIYEDMISRGVCPEQARAVLPQAMMTEWIWTGSLYAWSRMCNLRLDPHAQREVQTYAAQVSDICRTLFPLSWSALTVEVNQ